MLSALLLAATAAAAPQVVYIKADEEALYSSVMAAMDQLHQAGVEDIALITERKREGSGGGGQ